MVKTSISRSEKSPVVGQPIRYASYVYASETSLYYLQARYYDPETARFVSRDPELGTLDNPLSQNAYAYANDDPVNYVDPVGKFAIAIPAGIEFALYAIASIEILLISKKLSREGRPSWRCREGPRKGQEAD